MKPAEATAFWIHVTPSILEQRFRELAQPPRVG
jgi:hypothetical protein